MTRAAPDNVHLHRYDDRATASSAAADRLTANLSASLARTAARTVLVVSGGTSPGECLRQLSAESLDWSRVLVTLSDERWVAADDDDSNERLLRQTLLQGNAAAASLLPHYRDGLTVEEGAAALDASLAVLPTPFAACLLGMGEDGHFASLFPDFAGLAAALVPDTTARCVAVTTRASNRARTSLTLPVLLASDEIVLLIFGTGKARVLNDAMRGASDLPVASLFEQDRTPVHVYWAP